MFSWGEAGTLGTGEVRSVGAGWGKVSRGTLWCGGLRLKIPTFNNSLRLR